MTKNWFPLEKIFSQTVHKKLETPTKLMHISKSKPYLTEKGDRNELLDRSFTDFVNPIV